MLRVSLFLVVALGAAVAAMPSPASAQYDPFDRPASMMSGETAGNAISTTGTATVSRPPDSIRMMMELTGKGATLEKALADLKDRSDAARIQLDALKADPKSIRFSDPTLSGTESRQREQFEAMVRQRLGSRAAGLPKGPQLPKTVAVSFTLSAEWPLAGQTPEQLLVEVEALREKVEGAKLAGAQQKAEMTPEEAEVAEEMAQMMSGSGEEPLPVGQPHFVYVARISDADCDKAVAEAFADAKQGAQRLARAAGVELGPLVALSGGGGGQSQIVAESYLGYSYERASYLRQLAAQTVEDAGNDRYNEAVNYDPAAIRFVYIVRAAFALGK